MIYYLLDASVVVLEYDPRCSHLAKDNMTKLIESGKKKEAVLFLPDFCVVEAFNTLAKWFWSPDDKRFATEKQYRGAYEQLERSVKRRGLYYAYDLHRYHVLNCDEIFKAEHTSPREEDRRHPGSFHRLSSFDILIIAMGMELTRIHAEQSVWIVSGDHRLVEIARQLQGERPGEFAKVFNPYEPQAELPSELTAFQYARRLKKS